MVGLVRGLRRYVSIGLLSVLVLIFIPFADEFAVFLIQQIIDPTKFTESGEQSQYLQLLVFCGKAGKKEARDYVLRHYWHNSNPANGYGMLIVKTTARAFIGLSTNRIIEMLGSPICIDEQKLIYLGKFGPDTKVWVSGLAIETKEGHVVNIDTFTDRLDEVCGTIEWKEGQWVSKGR